MKKIILCADDYAQNPEVSQAILSLISIGRLSAVSCMTAYKYWPEDAQALQNLIKKEKLENKIDVGLHFDLGPYQREQGWSFNQLIISAAAGRIDRKKIGKNLVDQLDAFETHFGQAPNFVDGHQHVHSFPSIRNIFLHTLHQRYGEHKPYLRISNPPLKGLNLLIKTLALKILVSGFAGQAQKLGFKFPQHFDGAYSLTPTNYRKLFQTWLARAQNPTLIMCHPGFDSNLSWDPIRNTRPIEFSYFASDDFLIDLKNSNAELSTFKIA